MPYMRNGKRDYAAEFASRMHGSGVWAELIRQRFLKATARLGFNRERIALDLGQFRSPPPVQTQGQGRLF